MDNAKVYYFYGDKLHYFVCERFSANEYVISEKDGVYLVIYPREICHFINIRRYSSEPEEKISDAIIRIDQLLSKSLKFFVKMKAVSLLSIELSNKNEFLQFDLSKCRFLELKVTPKTSLSLLSILVSKLSSLKVAIHLHLFLSKTQLADQDFMSLIKDLLHLPIRFLNFTNFRFKTIPY
jgi:hypothetical protein